MYQWIIDEDDHQRMLREYLLERRQISKRALTSIKYKGGKILVNGEEKTVRYILQQGDRIEIIFPPEKRSGWMTPVDIPLSIIYEDEHVLVINKPPKLATIPSRHHPTQTLANGIIHYYDQKGLPYTVHVVTRLDRDTSGLVLIAKQRYSHSILFQYQQEKKIKRSYGAIVEGTLKEKKGVINYPIARASDSILKRMVSEIGQQAITHYQVREETSVASLVDLYLETGRTHQIRVHCEYIGHPLFGDSLYNGNMDFIDRQALHCQSLTFQHPTTREEMHFEIALPDDMEKLWSELKDLQ